MIKSLTPTPRFSVEPGFVRSDGDLYALDDIQHVRLRRPWLAVTGAAAAGTLALASVFWPELLAHEKAIVVALCAAATAISARLGRLKLSSLVLDQSDGIIWAEYGALKQLAREIEHELTTRNAKSNTSRQVTNPEED
jgi:hypothetical protein